MSGIVVRIETTQSQVALMNLTKGIDALEQEILIASKRFDAFSLAAKRAVDPKPFSSFATTVQGVNSALQETAKGAGKLAPLQTSLRNSAAEAAEFQRKLAGSASTMKSFGQNLTPLISFGTKSIKQLTGIDFANFIQDTAQVGIVFERMRQQLTAVTGSSSLAKAEIDQLNSVCNVLGYNILTTTDAFTEYFVAATRAGFQTQEINAIFESFITVARAMGLSGPQVSDMVLDLADAFKDGRVTGNELLELIGKHLPGAAEKFRKVLEKLPAEIDLSVNVNLDQNAASKAINVLKNNYASMAADAASGVEASIARTQNAITALQKAFVDTGAIETFAKSIGGVFEYVVRGWDHLPSIIQSVGVIGAVIGGVEAKAALLLISAAIGLVDKFFDTDVNDVIAERAKVFNELLSRQAVLQKQIKELQNNEKMAPARKTSSLHLLQLRLTEVEAQANAVRQQIEGLAGGEKYLNNMDGLGGDGTSGKSNAVPDAVKAEEEKKIKFLIS